MKRMLWRAAALALVCCLALAGGVAYASFSDVKADKWYAGAVAEMEASGLLKGYSDGTFRPNRTISAAEFVAIVGRCSGEAEGTGQTSHWAAGWLQTGLDKGWYDWDEIPPTGERFDQPISRQGAVKILMRALLPNERGVTIGANNLPRRQAMVFVNVFRVFVIRTMLLLGQLI